MKKQHEVHPLSPSVILSGIIITVVGGLILFFIQNSLVPTTSNEVITPTLQITSSAAPSPSFQSISSPVLFDDFSSNSMHWTTDRLNEGSGVIDLSIVGGKYRWVATPLAVDPNVALWHREIPSNVPVLTDLDLEAKFTQTGDAREVRYGFDFRQSEKGYYTFHLDNHRRFVLGLYDEATQKWDEIIKWTDTSLVNPTGANKLKVVAQGPSIRLYINDGLAGSVDDARLSVGKAGISITVWGKDQTAVLEIDDVLLSEIP